MRLAVNGDWFEKCVSDAPGRADDYRVAIVVESREI